MPKYRKRSLIIEAAQWTGSTKSFNEILNMGLTDYKPGDMGSYSFYIPTKEGDMKVSKGDWVIKEPFDTERKFYPCKPDIFEQTYELVEE